MDTDALHEQAYLIQTKALIQRGIADLLEILDSEQEKLREAKLELQENQPAFAEDRDKQTETAQYLSGLQMQLSAYRAYADRLRKLNMLDDSPYFGRIDFAEEQQKTESYYIGRASLRDQLTFQMQVIDWRYPWQACFIAPSPAGLHICHRKARSPVRYSSSVSTRSPVGSWNISLIRTFISRMAS